MARAMKQGRTVLQSGQPESTGTGTSSTTQGRWIQLELPLSHSKPKTWREDVPDENGAFRDTRGGRRRASGSA